MRLDLLSIAFSVGIVACHGAPIHAQHPSRAGDAHEFAEALRTRQDGGLALGMLRQTTGAQTRSQLDALADTLASIILSQPGSDTTSDRVRRLALDVLAAASSRSSRGIPYAGGGQRLARIVQQSPDVGVRARALSAVSVLPNKDEALAILRSVATSESSTARLAVTLLLTEMGESGLVVLEDLYRTGAITEQRARWSIEALARERKWDNSPSNGSPMPAHGQQPSPRPGPLGIGELLRDKREVGAAVRLLTQIHGPQPRSRLDAVADTLVTIALSHPGYDTAAFRIRRLALRAVAYATMPSSGVAYAGGPERLLRVVQQSRDGGERAYALSAISRLPNRDQARQMLRQVAVSENRIAALAVGLLTDTSRVGPEGLAILMELYDTSAVTEPRARSSLESIAHHRQWPEPRVRPAKRPPGLSGG